MEQLDNQPAIRVREDFQAQRAKRIGKLGIRTPVATEAQRVKWFGAPPTPLESAVWRPKDFKF